jgi:hypothetical protein
MDGTPAFCAMQDCNSAERFARSIALCCIRRFAPHPSLSSGPPFRAFTDAMASWSMLRASPGWPLSYAILATLKPWTYIRVRPCDTCVAPLATRRTRAYV